MQIIKEKKPAERLPPTQAGGRLLPPIATEAMKMIVNPKYERLRSYLRTINVHFEREGREIHSGRNTIKTLSVDDLTLCVKRYAPPSLRGRLACALYKSSKARRAYMAPLLLRERGFESPEPVAFVTYRTGLLKSSSYFICLQSDYRHSMCDVEALPPAERTEVVRAFARFAARLHEDGFLHRDFSSGNILYDRRGDRLHFALVDTNTVRCGRAVSIEKGCANLAHLSGSPAFFHELAAAYAAERGADAERCERLIRRARGAR